MWDPEVAADRSARSELIKWLIWKYFLKPMCEETLLIKGKVNIFKLRKKNFNVFQTTKTQSECQTYYRSSYVGFLNWF